MLLKPETIIRETAADMQKVILLPKMTLKEHFIVSRLVTFNETFASLNNTTDYVMLWHEGIAGRCPSDVASAYMNALTCVRKTMLYSGQTTVLVRIRTGFYSQPCVGVLTKIGDPRQSLSNF